MTSSNPNQLLHNPIGTGVDIVTPVYGQAKLLENMLQSLLLHEAGAPWRIWLVDDRGPERMELDALYAKYKAMDPRIQILRNPRNAGFAGSNNAGFRAGRAPLLLMLNSDIEIIQDGWLGEMAEEFNNTAIGVVGAKLLFFDEYESSIRDHPPGKVQHAGVVFNLLGQPYHLFIGWSPDHPKVNQRRELNAVTGACLMTRRVLYERIGGLDLVYRAGNFEDVEYCLRVRAEGFKVVYQPKAVLRHYAGGSGNSTLARENETIFRLRCQGMRKSVV